MNLDNLVLIGGISIGSAAIAFVGGVCYSALKETQADPERIKDYTLSVSPPPKKPIPDSNI